MVVKKQVRGFGLLILVLALALAGCQGAVPNTGATPPVGTVVPAQAVAAAQTWLAQQLGVQALDVTVLESEQVDWSDSCLGLGGPAESCAQVVTPGWQVVLTVNGQQYTLRTDQNGTVVRQAEPAPTPGA